MMMYGLNFEDIQRIKKVFEKHESIEKVILYGSRANGTFRPNSDIDLTLVGENISGKDLLRTEIELDDLLLPYNIDLSIYHNINNQKLAEHINRVGQVFYDGQALLHLEL